MTNEEMLSRLRSRPVNIRRQILLDKAIIRARIERDRLNVTKVKESTGFLLRQHRQGWLKTPNQIVGFQNALESYRAEKDKIDNIDIGLSISGELLKNAVGSVGGASSRTRGGIFAKFSVEALKATAVVSVDRSTEQFIDKLKGNSQRRLGLRVKHYMLSKGATVSHFDNMDVEVIASELRLNEFDEILEGFPEMDDIARIAMVEPLLTTLARVVIDNRLSTIVSDLEIIEDIEQLEKKLVNEDARVWEIVRKNRDDIAKLAEYFIDSTNALREGVATNRNSIGDALEGIEGNRKDILALAAILGGNVGPEKKIRLIELGLIEVPEGQTELVVAELKDQVDHQIFCQTASKVVQEGQALVSVLVDLGADSAATNRINEIVSFGATAFTAYMSFQTGHYFTGISAVTGFLGGSSGENPGPDPAVMAAFEKIFRSLKEIDVKLERLLKGQEELALQIGDLEKKVEVGFKKIDVGISNIIDLNIADIKVPLNFLESRLDHVRLNARGGLFASYNQFKELSALGVQNYWKIFAHLSMGDDEEPSAKLLSYPSETNLPVVTDSQSASFTRLIALQEKFGDWLGGLDESDFFKSALCPTDRIFALKVKASELELLSPNPCGLENVVPRRFGALIHVGMLDRVSNAAIEYHYIKASFKSDNTLASEQELLAGHCNFAGSIWLQDALRLVLKAQCQQTVFSGDILLPYIYDLFKGTLSEPVVGEEDYDLKIEVLSVLSDKNLSILRKNIGLYFFRERIFSLPNPPVHNVQSVYSDALNRPEQLYRELHNLTNTGGDGLDMDGPIWNILSGEAGPFLFINESLSIPVPPSERISNSSAWQLYFPQSFGVLQGLKEALTEHIQTYSIADEVDVDVYNGLVFTI